jgi:exopolysaccharide biosynthesis polyprenyl glycosylphosphotransferase
MDALLPLREDWLLPIGLLAAAAALPLRAAAGAALECRPFARRTLIVGAGPLARRILEAIGDQPRARYAPIGVVADGPAGLSASIPGPILGTLWEIDAILGETRPDRVIVALDERRGRLPVGPLLEARARGVVIEDGVEVYERLTGKIAIESLAPSGLIFSGGFRGLRLHRAVARALSVAGAAVGLILAAPLLALIALLIALESRGGVLFVQERAGLGGRPFRLLKFRTMLPASGPHSEWAGDNGDRITRIGKWLRRFRLDELPQFVNVLRGDMNLIGPRPHPVSNFDLFQATVPYYRLRASMLPGVTGWAQVRYGYANGLEEETEKMRYDLYYIKHRSLGMDLRILLQTARIVLLGRGSDVDDARVAETGGAAALRWPRGQGQHAEAAMARHRRPRPRGLEGHLGRDAGPRLG